MGKNLEVSRLICIYFFFSNKKESSSLNLVKTNNIKVAINESGTKIPNLDNSYPKYINLCDLDDMTIIREKICLEGILAEGLGDR